MRKFSLEELDKEEPFALPAGFEEDDVVYVAGICTRCCMPYNYEGTIEDLPEDFCGCDKDD